MFGKIKKFVEEVRAEMAKVTWSSRQELMSSTAIVLSAMAILAVFIGAVDLFFSQILKILLRT